MRISLIVAMDRCGLIGKEGKLPWHLSADLRRFKAITWGKPIVMGRKTHVSIGRKLPGRENIVLTRNPEFKTSGCIIMHDLETLFSRYANTEEIMVIGGAAVYTACLPLADKLFITEIDTILSGDRFFPPFDRNKWREIDRQTGSADQHNDFDHNFIVLKRQQKLS